MPRLLPRLLALLLAGAAISACAVYPENRPYYAAYGPAYPRHEALYGPGPGWRPGWTPGWGYRPGYAARYGRPHHRHYDDD